MPSTDLTVGVLVERDGRYLTIEERVSGALVVTQPGGHIEAGESPEAAAEREALEESGCAVDVQELLGVYLWIHPRTGQRFLRIMFLADLVEQRPEQSLDAGIEAVRWLAHAELCRRRHELRTPVVLRCVEDYRCGRRQSDDVLRNLTPTGGNVPAVLASASLV